MMILVLQATLGAAMGQQRGDSRPDVSLDRLHYYAIVGAVRVPATFSTDQPEIDLRDVLTSAGGLTHDDPGEIRIIHRGRQRNLIFSSSAELLETPLRVPSGATIVVDSSHPPQDTGFVHVACINLLERPVVLGGSPARMTLQQILEKLGQSRLSADTVQTLPRIPPPVAGSGIPAGTVLVFDPSAIDRTELQRVFQEYRLTDVLPLHGHDHAQQPVVAVVAETPLLDERQLPTETEVLPAAPVPPTEPDEAPLVVAAPRKDEAVRANVPVIEPSHQAAATTADGSADPVPPQEDPVQEHRLSPEPHAKRISSDSPGKIDAASLVNPALPHSNNVPQPQAPSRPEHLGSQILYAAAAAAALALLAILGAVLWSRRERRQLRDRGLQRDMGILRDSPSDDAPRRNVLDLLINDELPIVVEEVVLPDGTEFHGRAVGFRYLMRHGQQSLRGPHFNTAAQAEDASQPDSAARSANSRPTADSGAKTGTAKQVRHGATATVSPMERALLTQQRGTSQ